MAAEGADVGQLVDDGRGYHGWYFLGIRRSSLSCSQRCRCRRCRRNRRSDASVCGFWRVGGLDSCGRIYGSRVYFCCGHVGCGEACFGCHRCRQRLLLVLGQFVLVFFLDGRDGHIVVGGRAEVATKHVVGRVEVERGGRDRGRAAVIVGAHGRHGRHGGGLAFRHAGDSALAVAFELFFRRWSV